MDTQTHPLDNGITWDYLITNPNEITIETLTQAGALKLSSVFNNFYLRFTGDTQDSLEVVTNIIGKIRAKQPIDHDELNELIEIKDTFNRILGGIDLSISQIVEEGLYNQEDINQFIDRDFIYYNVNDASLVGVLNGTINDPRIEGAVNFTIELYKRMRAQGFSHWEDLCI
jgi:hypothetical protein